MLKGKLIAIFYISVLCLYQLYGILYSDGIFSYFVLLSLLGISFYYAIWANMKTKVPRCITALNVLLIMFTIYGVALILFGTNTVGFPEIDKKSFLKYIYISLLPIYSFYGLTKKQYISESTFRIWIPIFIMIAVFSYFHYEQKKLEEMGKVMVEGLTNNQSYLFVAILPTILFIKRSSIKYICLAICIIFIVMSMKRGAILVGFVCILYYIKSGGPFQKKNRIWSVIILLALGILTYRFLLSELSDNAYFLMRLNDTIDGYSSGRDTLYKKAIQTFINEDNPFYFFFGRGAYATLQVLGKFAHNDWLEILVCQGLLGVIIYIVYWANFIKTCFNTCHVKALLIAYRMSIIIMFMTSLFSMSYSSTPFALCMVVGYYLAHIEVKSCRHNIVSQRL